MLTLIIFNGRAPVRPSVRLPVYPIDREQQWRPAGLLLSALRVRRYRLIAAVALRAPCCKRWRSASNEGIVMSRADEGACYWSIEAEMISI